MLGLPRTTEIRKRLTKKEFYAKFHLSEEDKKKLDHDIAQLTLVNEIAPGSVNLPAGDTVSSIFVLRVGLKQKEFSDKTILTLSKLIAQNILFVLEFDGQGKLAVYHVKLMQTEWKPAEDCRIELRGLTLDKVWENIVVDVGGINLTDGHTLEEQIAIDERRQKLEKEIARLEKLARAERQPKKKFELVQRINKLKRELEV